jgi:hypothetical protein
MISASATTSTNPVAAGGSGSCPKATTATAKIAMETAPVLQPRMRILASTRCGAPRRRSR